MTKMFGYECEFNPCHDGKQYVFKFQNGFGASVVQHRFSYGGDKGLWELGVLDNEGRLTYDTEITDDVIGYLSESEVQEVLNQIRKLPSETAVSE